MNAHPAPTAGQKALVLGFLSTVGDLEVLHEVEAHLARNRLPYSVAAFSAKVGRGNPDWVDARSVAASEYSHLIVVCGPFFQEMYARERDLFARFEHCTWIGVNLSMIAPLADLNPFDALIERDSERVARPDLSFLQVQQRVPVVGLCLATKQGEYGDRQQHAQAEAKLRALIDRSGVAVVNLDTRWPASRNDQGTANPGQFESLCARVDVMLTTRLHGMVLSLKNGTPVIAVDAIAGGDKLTTQARLLDWPEIFAASDVTPAALDQALERCLLPEARSKAQQCAQRAAAGLGFVGAAFDRALAVPPQRHPLSRPKRMWLDVVTRAKLIDRSLKRK